MRYVTIAALIASLGAVGFGWWQYARATRLAHEVAILKAQNETCSKRIKNILEAQKDAEEVNSWGGLSNVPLRWLLPETEAGD